MDITLPMFKKTWRTNKSNRNEDSYEIGSTVWYYITPFNAILKMSTNGILTEIQSVSYRLCNMYSSLSDARTELQSSTNSLMSPSQIIVLWLKEEHGRFRSSHLLLSISLLSLCFYLSHSRRVDILRKVDTIEG